MIYSRVKKIKLNIGDAMKEYVNTFIRYRFLLGELVKKGIKLKYRRSYLGIIWSLLEPLLTMIVLTIVFGTLFGNKDRTFPVYILTGRLLYTFYSSATKAALKSVRANSAMIKKVYVPKYLYPLSSVLFNYVIFLISLIVLVPVGAVLGVEPTLYAPDPDRADPGIFVVLWLWNDPCYDWRFFQRYGISVVSSADADHVYLCDLLLSVQTAEKWLFMDPEI